MGLPEPFARRLSFLSYRFGAELAQRLPHILSGPSTQALSRVFTVTMAERRMMMERHLQRVHGQGLQGAALRRAVHQSFDSYAQYWLESFALPRETPSSLDARMRAEGVHHLDDALAAGRGVILALPHLGAWDFGGAWLASKGYNVSVVVEPVEPPELFDWFAAHRRAIGLDVIPLGPDTGQQVVTALNANRLVALLCDRDLTGTGVEVEFFGEVTTLPAGPAVLALRTGAALIPTAAYFDATAGHLGVVRPPMSVGRVGKFREDVVRLTQAVAVQLEELIRVAPEQWHLMQPNWPSDRAVSDGRQ